MLCSILLAVFCVPIPFSKHSISEVLIVLAYWLLIIFMVFCLNRWAKRKNIVGSYFYGAIAAVITLCPLFIRYNNYEIIVINKSGMIGPAQVYDSYRNRRKASSYVLYYFVHNNKSYTSKVDIPKTDYYRLKRGDTILVIYAEIDPDCNRLYKLFPSKEEIELYKNGVPYRNGKVILDNTEEKDSLLDSIINTTEQDIPIPQSQQ